MSQHSDVEASALTILVLCPFCGGGDTSIRENGRVWTGRAWGTPSSVSVWHHCERVPGQPTRAIERVGRDHVSAVAAWNMRAPISTSATSVTPSAIVAPDVGKE